MLLLLVHSVTCVLHNRNIAVPTHIIIYVAYFRDRKAVLGNSEIKIHMIQLLHMYQSLLS